MIDALLDEAGIESTKLWRKAAVLGSIWAVSEIVLGTFLHNAQVPLRGHILTGIGIATLVAGHGLWPERGLLWRSGLVCAAMKSISPSAVILSPMIAITLEGFLMEAGFFVAGPGLAGGLLAGGLAMSGTMLHKIGNILIFYGPETWALYSSGLAKLCAWLGYASSNPWTPLLVIFVAHFLGGGAAALVGRRIARESGGAEMTTSFALPRRKPAQRIAPTDGTYSLAALALHCVFALTFMSLGQSLAFPVSVCVAALYSAVCVAGHARARTIVSRADLWAGVVVVAALAGILLGRWESGFRMGFRAVLLTLAFSCIAEELRNPRLAAWMARRGGRTFFAVLEQSFEALPEIVAHFPSPRDLFRDPASAFRNAVGRSLALLEDLRLERVTIITGGHGTGKSETVSRLADEARRAGYSVGGIHAPGLWEGSVRTGFDLVDLRTGERVLLCRRQGAEDWLSLGPYKFSPEGLRFGREALSQARRREVDHLFVDEVGDLELQGHGWAGELDALMRERRKTMVWVVRPQLVDAVKERWGLPDARSISATALSQSLQSSAT